MNSIKSKSTAVATVALLLSSIIFPLPASAAPRDVGEIEVDCDPGYLQDAENTIYFYEVGDTFTITNIDDAECLIQDPNNILTGEDADHTGDGAGILGESDGTPDTTLPITIDASGSFTITEDGGDGEVFTFNVMLDPYFDFSNGSDVGDDFQVNDSFTYQDVTVIDGTTVDAIVTVNQIVNIDRTDPDSLPILDRSSNSRIGTYFNPTDGMEGYVEYTVEFFEDNDPTSPVTITDLALTVKDIDELQYISAENVDSFNLSSSPATKLTPRRSGNVLFIEELNDISSDTSDEDHWAVLKFDSTSSVTLRIGSKDGSAYFGVVFSRGSNASEEFTNPPSETTADSVGASNSSTPASTTTPKLATTGANVEWLMIAGLIAAIAGASFLTVSRRKRTA
jgi:LPXTG-motif cell wall-anchored protein